MSVTRASIDRKLDRLASRTQAAKRQAVRRTMPVAAFLAAALGALWWRRHCRRVSPAGFVRGLPSRNSRRKSAFALRASA